LTARGMAAMVGSNTVGIITNYNATDVVINGINLGTGGGLFGTTFGNATLSLGGIGNSYYVACGFGALQNATDIQDVVAVGFGALSSLIMGRQEVAVGTVSLASLTNGMANTGVGESVLTALKNGSNNTAVGNGASEELLSGNANSTFGTHCLWALTNGYGNVAFGQDAGRYQNSGATLSNALNSIYIGTSASALADGANNEIVIGTSAAGNGNNTAVIGSPVQPYLQTNFTAYGTFSFGQPINGHMAILFTDGTNLWFSNVNGVINKLTSN